MTDDTLVIELEPACHCCNPVCGAEIEVPGPERRYCPQCGAAQVYECEACLAPPRGLLVVTRDCACPRCGTLFVECAECRHPVAVTPGHALSCPEGCQGELKAARGGTHEPLVHVQRTGAVSVRADGLPGGTAGQWKLGEQVSRLACRFGRVFVATGRGTIRAVNEETGEDVEAWQQRRIVAADPVTLGALGLRVSQRHVYFVQDGKLTACFVGDGTPLVSLATALREPEAVFSPGPTERLLVCGLADATTLSVELRDPLDLPGGEPRVLRSWQLPAMQAGQPQPVPVASWAGDAFLIGDLEGNVLRISADPNEDSRTLWANSGYEYVSAPAVTGRWAYLLVHSRARGGAVVRLGLRDGSVVVRRLQGITPAYIGLRVTSQALYLFDGERDFYEVDLTAPGAAPRPVFCGVEMMGDMALTSLVALERPGERGAWLVYLVGSPGQMTPRTVHTATAARPDLPPPEGCSDASIAVSDRRIFVADPRTGEVLGYGIPEA